MIHDPEPLGDPNSFTLEKREFETEVIYRVERARILLSTSADQITESTPPRKSRSTRARRQG